MNIVAPLFAVHRVVRASFTIVLASACFTARAQVNSWINPISGNWDQATNWSLGVLPNSSQSVVITNSGFKAVGIDPSTPINFPGSMTVSSLTIQGATNSENTLLLNFFGTNVPLTVLNGLTLEDGAQILDFNSGLVVQGGTLTVTNSQINQDGGLIVATNVSLQDSLYNLTNGDFEAGSMSLASGAFNQYGGTAIITNLGLMTSSGGSIQDGISLYGGTLNLPGGIDFSRIGQFSYFQAGGTNQTPAIFVGVTSAGGGGPNFTLNGGLLADNNMTLLSATDSGSITVTQNGGSHVITNGLSIQGASQFGEHAIPATYNLNGGMLSAGSIDLDADQGDSVFVQSNGTTSAETVSAHSAGFGSQNNTHITLTDGALSCSNYTTDDGGATLDQSGGALVVSNLLDFGGVRFANEPFVPYIYGTYTFTGGTLSASNINITGVFSIGDGIMNQISNPGFFSLSHTLQIGNAVAQLGQFILVSNATIDLSGSASQLSFANSSGQTWVSGATLVISNWNGNPFGGGAEQLKFGTDQSGLTPAQVNQIQFRIGTNLFPTEILNTGEVVPNQSSSISGLVNSWTNPASGNWDQATNWSLGILPNSSQTVVITNSGFKAVAINSSTPINFPGSMSVSNLTILSPTNSANTLLMNFVGAGNPLVVGVNNSNEPGSLVIGDTNSAMVMFSSGLIVNNTLGTNNSRLGEFAVNGSFTQSDSSEVVAGFLDLNSAGTYNLTNGQLFVGSQFINGTFNHQGGTNFGAVVFTDGGKYNLFDGVLQGSVGLDAPVAGVFNQSGGTDISSLDLSGPGVYQLSGGLLVPGDLQVGPSSLSPSSFGAGSIVQTGGTNNAGNITMGVGNYSLEGGVLTASNLALPTVSDRLGSFGSSFSQSGGSFSNSSISMNGVVDPRNGLQPSTYTLSGGELQTPTITMTMGLVNQTGGTNSAGVVTLNTLSSYNFTNGLLIATNIEVTGQATFVHAGGSFGGLDNILLAGGGWVERTTGEQLGQLQLGSGTNSSTMNLPSGSCVLRFADSSGVAWTSDGRLTIQNWSGSTNGGGADQIFFGSSASGLTMQQLSQVRFSNPAGLPPGTYSARILSDGEVVPNQVIAASVAFSQQGNNLVLTWPTGWTLQSATNVAGPYSDATNATSPYTNNMTILPQQFFRLRQ